MDPTQGPPDDPDRVFFTAVLAAPIPPPRVPVSPTGPERCWHPTPTSPVAVEGKLVDRHPAYRWGLEDLPPRTVRQAHRTASRGRFGKFASQKTGRAVRSRNSLEFDLHRDWEVDPSVLDFIERPVKLRYRSASGRIAHHIPAAAVRRRGAGPEFVDLAWEDSPNLAQREARWERIGRAFASLGFPYRVISERDVRGQPRHRNIEELFRSRHVPPPPAALVEHLTAVLRHGPVSLAQICHLVPGLLPRQVPWLILRGYLSIDLAQPLESTTLGRLGPAARG